MRHKDEGAVHVAALFEVKVFKDEQSKGAASPSACQLTRKTENLDGTPMVGGRPMPLEASSRISEIGAAGLRWKHAIRSHLRHLGVELQINKAEDTWVISKKKRETAHGLFN